MGIDDIYYWGSNAVQTFYEPNTDEIVIVYVTKENGTKRITCSYKNIKYELYNHENDLPKIDREKAYEMYGVLN